MTWHRELTQFQAICGSTTEHVKWNLIASLHIMVKENIKEMSSGCI